MLVRGMGQHHVEHHTKPALACLDNQPVGIIIAAEQRIDLPVIGNVIAEIIHRRGKEWRNPHSIDAETGNIIQPLNDARQIADTVSVAILIGPRIDLIDHRAAPPIFLLHKPP